MEKDLVEYIVKNLVDNPDQVSVNVVEGEKSTILELKVADEDVGKVIGKQGRIAKAIRTIRPLPRPKAASAPCLRFLTDCNGGSACYRDHRFDIRT